MSPARAPAEKPGSTSPPRRSTPDLPDRCRTIDRVPERVVRALTAGASEPLATDQADRDRRTTERILAMRQRQQEQQRARTEQRLADAEAKLDRLGWRDRRKHGAKLRTEIDFQPVGAPTRRRKASRAAVTAAGPIHTSRCYP
jgi:hypothetical protein